jgi:predicted amidohydrolase
MLPELFLTGYNVGDAVSRLAEPNDGPSARTVARIAAAARLAILYGYPERTPEGVYNAAAVIDATGRPVANYRKVHLWGDFEKAQFRPGSAPCITALDGMRFGLQICYDLDFPELTRAAVQAGADGILAISATSAPYTVVPRHLVPARAYEGQLFVAFANRPGIENGLAYAGESCVAAPDGTILAGSGAAEALVYAEIEPARYAAYVRDHRSADALGAEAAPPVS